MIDRVDTQVFDRHRLNQAAQALKEGKLVAFPTETVFGLGAIANNEQAVQSVFKAKGRPSDNPLIIHVSSIASVYRFAKEVTPLADTLMKNFWPGPLTIIFPVEEGVFAPSATAHHLTAGMRMPAQMETLLTIDQVGFPIVGPSANLSTKPSPTSLDHVLHDFDGRIAGVIANSKDLTDIGVESTVVLPLEDRIEILRPGAITKEMLEETTGLPVREATAEDQLNHPELMSPGVKYRHYSPKQAVYMVTAKHELSDWEKLLDEERQKVGLLADNQVVAKFYNHPKVTQTYALGEIGDAQSAARHLFDGLRRLEMTDCQVIYAQGYGRQAIGGAYMNRLSHAASSML